MTATTTVDPAGLFGNIKRLKEILAQLEAVGIDWSKLGPVGEAVLDAIKVIRDPAATIESKVNAAIVVLEKFSVVTEATWDDTAATALRSLEPLIVRLMKFVSGQAGAATLDSTVLSAEAAAFGFDLPTLWKLAQTIWEIIQLFLKKE